ncbi:MAG: serine/threonine protein kinase [Planctomycetes bacterium]|nr:serine/threonine protein kinase [Planctomycetota bacterium]
MKDTVEPESNDPLFDQMGSTHVVEGLCEPSLPGAALNSPGNYTEMSPSRVLGKNINRLGDFQLLKKLGEGAMGAVYKAKQISFDRTVALKVLFPHVASNPKLTKRLHREGEVMGQLDHPNIVQAYAYDEGDGYHFIAMEYVPGQSTQKWLLQLGRLPVADAIRIILDCAKALAYAHALNLVHRDIKPDNILLTRTGVVKVADFGMVKIDDEEMSLTQTGHAVGTPWFMPLEQARNAKSIDGRSDIYALGCTLYAFLTGQPPFVGRTIVDVIQAKEVGSFPPARQVNSDVPERVDLMIAKMTAKLPKYRYQSCVELIKDLEGLRLASSRLSFLQAAPPREPHGQETPVPGKTMVVPALVKSRADVDFAESAAPVVDPNLWFVQFKNPDGTVTVRQYDTAQLQRMLEEGTMRPTAKASHSPNDGFRTLGTYKEFQGVALSKTAKKAADKNTVRYRGLYKKLEEEDRAREEKERDESREETPTQANTRYWTGILIKVVPALIAAITLIGVVSWLASR